MVLGVDEVSFHLFLKATLWLFPLTLSLFYSLKTILLDAMN